MILNSRTIDDAKFFDKPILLFFTDENCKDCDTIYSKLQDSTIFSKYIGKKVNALEYIHYTIRLTRGMIPTITILSPTLDLLAVIESKDLKFIENKLRELLDEYKRRIVKGIKLEGYTPDPIEPTPSIIYETINKVIGGYEADTRMIEVYLTYTNVYKEYLKAKDKIKCSDDVARYLLEGKGEIKIDEKSSANVSMLVNYGVTSVQKLLDFIDINSGEVYRSKKKETKGILLDEALAGNALVSEYERTINEEYLSLAIKVADYIKNNLQHERGFRDIKEIDNITKVPYLEPISNSEASIFFSRLWNITGDETYKNLALKGLGSALGGALNNPKVIARAAIAYLKLFDSIKANRYLNIIDARITVVKNNGCNDSMLYYSGQCYSKIDEIQPTAF
ncbi:hypothetical protein SULI_06640 [Saccharolobus solfataricus]|uniref:Uncharacterized protein n=4 Tax=Saccharolobus solfataricus TaxID=2287 RepID=Q980H7_SACS2|nr:Hypothetical protein SSO0320 [Saccharolobus solfataricus P2]AKA73631.1 hypothetical protein SULB_1339 [Saccharolobus solfataricus]AKA76328.1 hypothetical protein SULC_1337 [Saccharolobus solfataricus]AKA79021.1 hypothetical protein SULA_1338 [Saccharolobus solfataricus]AZF68100.1 hypothetical protein SULG_06640 [Saccharolobus solfataricus]